MRRRGLWTALIVIVGLTGCVSAWGEAFERGSSRFSIIGSSGRAFNDDYFVIGAGYGYYLLNGLEVGVDAETWLGGDIDIYKLSPQIRYVFYQVRGMQPYVGAFYRKTGIESLEDLNSNGGRAGVFFSAGRGSYFGLGMVYEQYLGCSEEVYVSCSETYPEFSFGFGF